MEEGIATYSSILALRTSWTKEPGRLQSMGSQPATTEATEHTPTQSMLIMEKETFSYLRPLALCIIPQGKIANTSA